MLGARRYRRVGVLVVAVSLVGLTVGAQVPPLGPDFEVVWPDIHMPPVVSVDPYGEFLVAWAPYFGTAAVKAYDRDGGFRAWGWLPVTPNSERPIHVAPGSPVGFVAAWESHVDGDLESARLDSAGGMVGTPFVVNSSGMYGWEPRVAMAQSGDIVVVWTDDSSDGDDTSGSSIQARVFEPDGTPYFDRVQVNLTTAGDQRSPDLALGPGWFLVVWESESSAGTDQSGSSVQARGFTLDGSQASDEIQVNSHTPADQTHPKVVVGADGGFVVTWESASSSGDDASFTSIQARRYLPSWLPAGNDFQVNTYTPGGQVWPAIGMMDGGAFEIVWSSQGSPANPDEWSIQRQAFTAEGIPTGAQGPVSTTLVYRRGGAPAMSMNRHGDFVSAWDPHGFEIRARIFRNTLFVDGFESGDTSVWE